MRLLLRHVLDRPLTDCFVEQQRQLDGKSAFALVGGLLLLVTCTFATEPRFPPDAVPLAPMQPYALWWRLTESCSGRTGDLAAVRWYYVPGADTIRVGGQYYHGFWYGDGNRIVLAEKMVLAGSLVRHEMLHALTRKPRHDRGDFVDACGGIVACAVECASEAGAPAVPDANAPEMPLAELTVALRVDTAGTSIGSNGGWIGLEVSARNPRSTGAWALLTPIEGSPFSATFGYVVECIAACTGPSGSQYEFVEASRFGFTANAVRRRLFDRQLSPGVYSIRGTFNVDTTTAVTVTVTP